MPDAEKHTTLAAQQLFILGQHLTQAELYDFVVGSTGTEATITGAITQDADEVLIETEFGTLRYKSDQDIVVGRTPDTITAIKTAANSAGAPLINGPTVTIEIEETIIHTLVMPESDYKHADPDLLSSYVYEAASGTPYPGHHIEGIRVADLDYYEAN